MKRARQAGTAPGFFLSSAVFAPAVFVASSRSLAVALRTAAAGRQFVLPVRRGGAIARSTLRFISATRATFRKFPVVPSNDSATARLVVTTTALHSFEGYFASSSSYFRGFHYLL